MEPDTAFLQDLLHKGGLHNFAEQIRLRSEGGHVLEGLDWDENLTPSPHGDVWQPQCRRITLSGRRCERSVFDDLAYFYDDHGRPYVSAEDWERYEGGACSTHRYHEGRKA